MFINYLCSCSVDTNGSSCNCCNLCTLIFLIGLFLIILIFGSIILHFVLNKNKDKSSSNYKICNKMVKKLSKKSIKKVSVSIDKDGCKIEITYKENPNVNNDDSNKIKNNTKSDDSQNSSIGNDAPKQENEEPIDTNNNDVTTSDDNGDNSIDNK